MIYGLITHWDLDAATSWIIAHKIYPIRFATEQGYPKVSVKLEWLREQGVTDLIVTDLHLDQDQLAFCLRNFSKTTIYDHHVGTKIYTTASHPKLEIHFSENESSSLILLNTLVQKGGWPSKELLDLVRATDAYDTWNLTKRNLFFQGYELNILFWMYGLYDFVERFAEGLQPFTDKEKAYIQQTIADKRQKITESEFIEMDDNKHAVVFICKDPDIINDYALFRPEYTLYFILRNNKGKYLSMSGRVNGTHKNNVQQQIDLNRAVVTARQTWKAMQCRPDIIQSCGGHKEAVGIEFQPDTNPDHILEFVDLVIHKTTIGSNENHGKQSREVGSTDNA